MAKRLTVRGILNNVQRGKSNISRWYREDARKVKRDKAELVGIAIPHLDKLNVYHGGEAFILTWCPETVEESKQIRAAVGKAFGVEVWGRKVDPNYGDITYVAKFGKHELKIEKGELANGCQVVEVEETVIRKKFKSVCDKGIDIAS